MSRCTTRVPAAGTCQLVVSMLPVWLPIKKTRSASATTRLAQARL